MAAHIELKKSKSNYMQRKIKDNKYIWKPRQPLSAYIYFVKDKNTRKLAEARCIEELGDNSQKQVMSMIGKIWMGYTDEESEPYTEMAFKAKEKYEEVMEIWETLSDEEKQYYIDIDELPSNNIFNNIPMQPELPDMY